jgi:cystathionine beta-lyase/cystathionine gamma-synthase
MNTNDKGFNTKLIHAGVFEDEFGSATVPIYQTSTFKFKSAQEGADCFSGKSDGYIYTRIGNPTIRAFEKNITALENGYDGIATSSGMGAISCVYPGLESHPQHKLAKTQMKGFGSMMSFGLQGGYEAGRKLMDNVHLSTLAVSLGGVETLIQHPASMTHAAVSHENKAAAGITDDLVRFSVGIEDVEDIISDLNLALECC